ncbi:MAG: hypothetical protein Q9187_000604 [Circinaria calcarea]
MSIYEASQKGPEWPAHRFQSHSAADFGLGQPCDVGLGVAHGRFQMANVDSQPVLRPHRSLPYTVNSSNSPVPYFQRPRGQLKVPRATKEYSAGDRDYTFTGPENGGVTTTYSTGPLTSPIAQHAPLSGAEGDESADDVDEIFITTREPEGEVTESSVPKTAAERRAEKRKMKRFRLTHNQTRFLMSEFTRHAHPDAAQRERLSKEIPGLSPRQVQVWFQNRRAKLKRFTTDDRERMMRSRALPDGFDTTQTLYSPFANVPQSYSTPIASPALYPSAYGDGGIMQPLVADGLRRQSVDDIMASPISMSSALGSFYSPSGSGPVSETHSPISPASEKSQSSNHSIVQTTSFRNPDQFIQSDSFSVMCHTYRQNSRPEIHEGKSSMRTESLASPPWSTVSYPCNAPDYIPSHASSNGTFSEAGLWEPIKCSSLNNTNVPYNSGLPSEQNA